MNINITKQMKFASFVTLLVTSAFSASSLATNYYGDHSGWKCGSGKDNADTCSSSSYFQNDLMYSLVNHGISKATIDGVDIEISASAYSDTRGRDYLGSQSNSWHNKTTHYYGDEKVEEAALQRYGNGYGIINKDESSYDYPGHSADNQKIEKEGRYSKNWSTFSLERDNLIDTDYDFFLISFDKEVNVTGATFSWLFDGDKHQTSQQVSVAALGSTDKLNSGNSTWTDISDEALAKGSFDVLNCTDAQLAMFDFDNVFSQYWLVGAYNTVFENISGTTNDDGFKLASLGFNVKGGQTPPSQVSEPGTFAMLFMGGALVMWRRKRTS